MKVILTLLVLGATTPQFQPRLIQHQTSGALVLRLAVGQHGAPVSVSAATSGRHRPFESVVIKNLSRSSVQSVTLGLFLHLPDGKSELIAQSNAGSISLHPESSVTLQPFGAYPFERLGEKAPRGGVLELGVMAVQYDGASWSADTSLQRFGTRPIEANRPLLACAEPKDGFRLVLQNGEYRCVQSFNPTHCFGGGTTCSMQACWDIDCMFAECSYIPPLASTRSVLFQQ